MSSVATTDISVSTTFIDYRRVRYRSVRATRRRSESDIRREIQNAGPILPIELGSLVAEKRL